MHKKLIPLALTLVFAAGCGSFLSSDNSTGSGSFVSLFNGTDLTGWKLTDGKGAGYGVTNGLIYCARGGGGNLLTEKEFSNFVLRFEFRLEKASNNGIGIRAPMGGDAAYLGMEIQVLEDTDPQYANLRPAQYHGSVYDVFPAKRGASKPVGEWNFEEITANGRNIQVVLNGQKILDADLNTVTNIETLHKHPGLLRASGHVGFLGHNDYCEFRNIKIKELPSDTHADNVAPAKFVSLFNGKDLSGWHGLGPDPKARKTMAPAAIEAKQKKDDAEAAADWKVENGTITYRGDKFDNLCTTRDYKDYELQVDWKIEPKADSGLYLRGTPQVQIWEANSPNQYTPVGGSGGLYNNKKKENPDKPLVLADNPVGQWNHFQILMLGDKVHVYLNGKLVVQNTTLENYWEPSLPLYPTGDIELQAHKSVVQFKNIFVREIGSPK